VIGCVIVPFALLVLTIFLGALGLRTFVSYGMASDLTTYQADIRAMRDLDPQVRQQLLARFEKLRDRARHSSIGFWRWVDYQGSIKSLVDHGQLTPEEVAALNHELDNVEADLH
jgi:hypothetical protein